MSRSVVDVGREMAAKLFADQKIDGGQIGGKRVVVLSQVDLAQILAQACLAGYELCTEDTMAILMKEPRVPS